MFSKTQINKDIKQANLTSVLAKPKLDFVDSEHEKIKNFFEKNNFVFQTEPYQIPSKEEINRIELRISRICTTARYYSSHVLIDENYASINEGCKKLSQEDVYTNCRRTFNYVGDANELLRTYEQLKTEIDNGTALRKSTILLEALHNSRHCQII